MAIKNTNQGPASPRRLRRGGYALLVAVIFMSVMLSFGLTLSSLAYKQQVLASGAVESQYAFYAADAALECVLYADQQNNGQGSLFGYVNFDSGNPNDKNRMACDGNNQISVSQVDEGPGTRIVSTPARISLDNGTRCADVKVYKYSAPQPPNSITTYLFSQGYDVSCATVTAGNARIVSRGISVYFH